MPILSSRLLAIRLFSFSGMVRGRTQADSVGFSALFTRSLTRSFPVLFQILSMGILFALEGQIRTEKQEGVPMKRLLLFAVLSIHFACG